MSPAQNKSDFVNVRLSVAGRAFAGDNGVVRIANAHMNYKFAGDKPQRVLTSEWTKILSTEQIDGSPMFEIVPQSTTVPPQLVAAATQEIVDAH
ncbi:MAG: hypothetical protein BGO25_05560 [Acidobacteriales bacterium 59-55]|nr:hypothetical protein [Terriglobales bacterium]OJV44549.1 MAG: hypothetical protein BGO25_05560 [Acidobacteriales bacterium 59-55]